jgi:hypothetical protein
VLLRCLVHNARDIKDAYVRSIGSDSVPDGDVDTNDAVRSFVTCAAILPASDAICELGPTTPTVFFYYIIIMYTADHKK